MNKLQLRNKTIDKDQVYRKKNSSDEKKSKNHKRVKVPNSSEDEFDSVVNAKKNLVTQRDNLVQLDEAIIAECAICHTVFDKPEVYIYMIINNCFKDKFFPC